MTDYVLAATVPALLGGNIYFIKKLIDKIEAADTTAKEAKGAVNSIGGLLREIKQDIKDLRRIEIDVAILKNTFPNRYKKNVQNNPDDHGDSQDD